MKRYVSMLAGLSLFVTGPMFANELVKADHKADVRICKMHCDIHKLEDQIDALKSQSDSSTKTTEKEALKKKIAEYEDMLKKLSERLESQ